MSLIKSYIKHLGSNSRIYSMQELDDLLSADDHPGYMRKHRAALLLDRMRFLASLFTLLIPIWLVVDSLLLPLDLLWPIALTRLISTGHFYYLSRYQAKKPGLTRSLLMVGSLLVNLPLTFFASAHYLGMMPPGEMDQLMVQFYTMLPYIALGMVGLFPLALIECTALALLLVVMTVTGWVYYATIPMQQLLPTLWLLCIILCVVLFASTLQLQYMITFITRADHDPVTGAQTRKSGILSLVKAFQQAQVQNDSFSIALVDIDNSQNIITEFDYATYDHVVLEAAEILHENLRHNDMLVRWGEKVFLIILPGTDCEGAAVTVRRIHSQGLGTLPDDRPVTASISVCERISDHIEEWSEMLKLVDQRRDEVKREGKDHYILCGIHRAASRSFS